MDWRNAQSEEELRSLGKLKEVAHLISADLQGKHVPKGSWSKLLEFVQNFRNEPENEGPQKRQWQTVASVEELKTLGSFKVVKKMITEDLKPKKVVARGWEELYKCIKPQEPPYTSNYFKDEISEKLFYLLELEGELRLKKLGITKLHYKDKESATEWKRNMMKIIHPDQNTHIKATEGTIELNKMYEEMMRYAK